MELRSALGLGLAALSLASAADTAKAACAGVGCSEVAMPYSLTFNGSAGGLLDRNGAGTGFTMVDAPDGGDGYLPQRLEVDAAAGTLAIDTTRGIAYRGANSLDNALGIGVVPRNSAFSLWTTVMDLPAGAAGYSQAGLWFGASQDEYVKLVIITRSTGTHVQMLRESAGNVRALSDRLTLGTAAFPVSLRMRIDPVTRTVTGAYAIPGGAARQIASMSVSEALLYRGSFKGEQVATGGIFATYRLAPDPLRYAFDDFRAACVMSTCPSGPAAPDPDFGDGKPSVGVPDDEPPEDSTGPPPSSGSGPPAPARPGDPAPPGTARLDVRRRVRLATLRRTGLHASLTCPAGCGYRVRLSLPRAAARRLHLLRGTASRTTIARGRGAVLDAAQPARLAVRLSRRARRALAAGSMARLRLVLEVHVTPPAGAAVTLRRSVIATR